VSARTITAVASRIRLPALRIPRITFWRGVFLAIVGLGLVATVVRFTRGLGASTSLSDRFPWGIWVGFDVLCGVGLAAGGFTITGLVQIFGIKSLRPIVRPTVLTAFLGYMLVSGALLFDLGKPWNIWHPLVMWNPHSVMFEVAWCVMLYSTVLALEFSPILFERLGWKRPIKVVHAVSIPLVLAGVLLSTLHQSSLGSVFLIMPYKLSPLWYTPYQPVFFWISAVLVGLAMVIFESTLSSRAFRKRLDMGLLRKIALAAVPVLLVYLAGRFLDLLNRGALVHLLTPGRESALFLLEIALFAVPLVAFTRPRVLASRRWLFAAATCLVLGFILNRLNVSITGIEGAAGVRYFPSWMELAITAMIVAVGMALFSFAVKHLPIYPSEELVVEEGTKA
jgi:Ni/Fe-hydrogenase subunit HybB-like protein